MKTPYRFARVIVIVVIAGWMMSLVAHHSVQAASSPLTITPSADAYVSQKYPSTNDGTSAALYVDSSPVERSYLRFSVSGTGGSTITSATLMFFPEFSSNNGFAVSAITDSTWTETGITYDNAPAPGAILAESGAVKSRTWVSIDITPYITGDGTYNLALTPLASVNLRLASRESGSTAPQLVITLSSTSPPTPTLTSTQQATATPTFTPLASATPTSTPQASATPTTSPPGELSPTPSADAYVNQNSPTTNYGTNTSLYVDGSPTVRSYLRFSVTGTGGTTITSATLKVYADSSLSAGFAVSALNDSTWTETGITYDNAPAPGATLADSGAVSAGTWVSIDITPYITGDGTYNLVLTPLSSTNLHLDSRESGSTSPQLVITLGSGSLPTSTPTSTPLATATPASTSTPAPSPTPTSGGAGSVPNFSHVIVLIFENHEYGSIIGNSNLPNFNNLASQYTLLTQSYAVDHPSLPNYIAYTSGATQGITTDCNSCYVNVTNIADQVEASGRSWKAYMESMPSPCYLGDRSPYIQHHNPFVYFDDIRTNTTRCQSFDVPMTQLDTDLQNGTLPNFAWVTPNNCNNGHDCAMTTADAFLGNTVNKILSSPAWDANSLLVITFDEGSTSASCCGLPSSAGGHIATILVSPLVKNGYQDSTPYDHYSVLRTIEQSWGLSFLAHAADSATNVISAPWK